MYQKVNGVQVINMKKLLVSLTLPFLLWSLPVYANAMFPAAICVTQKVVTSDGVYIIFYSNGTRVIVTKAVFDSTNVGDCTWS